MNVIFTCNFNKTQHNSTQIEQCFSTLSLPYQRKSGYYLSVFRPPTPTNLDIFFEELTNSLSKAVHKYDNLIVMGDFNIDLNKTDCIGLGNLKCFRDNFNLTNLVKSNTCFTKKLNQQ